MTRSWEGHINREEEVQLARAVTYTLIQHKAGKLTLDQALVQILGEVWDIELDPDFVDKWCRMMGVRVIE